MKNPRFTPSTMLLTKMNSHVFSFLWFWNNNFNFLKIFLIFKKGIETRFRNIHYLLKNSIFYIINNIFSFWKIKCNITKKLKLNISISMFVILKSDSPKLITLFDLFWCLRINIEVISWGDDFYPWVRMLISATIVSKLYTNTRIVITFLLHDMIDVMYIN